ncbi:MAG: alpha/beta hydrolase [Nitrospinae bacterium]|nr:alpha/beta hydrolase [Nitrospinota bacterium]
MAEGYIADMVEVAETKLHLLRGGQGEPLVILHGAGGSPGWLQYQQALAQRFQVYVPDHPGFGKSDRPEWIASVPDLACFYLWALEELGLSRVRVVGFSLGGWLAAEMAVMYPQIFERMILVGAAGVKPPQGEIADIFIRSPQEVTALMFHDPKQAPEYAQLYGGELTAEQQDIQTKNREMAARIAWKPYMYDPRLPALLRRLRLPTLIVWGRQDAIVPLSCAEVYHQSIRGSNVVLIDQCGHAPQVEKPQEFVRLVSEFL